MVVLLPVEGFPTSTGRPPLFGILHHDGVPIATIRVDEYNWWTIGASVIYSVVSLVHKHLEGKWFANLRAAAQFVNAQICNVRTDCLRSVHLYLRGDLPDMIVDAPEGIKILAHQALAHAHVSARVQSYPSEVGDGRWLPIGKARPFIPPEMPRSAALNPSVWASFTPHRETASHAAAAAAESGDALAAGGGEGIARKRDDHDECAVPRKKKKKQRRKPNTEVGGVVWDGDATSTPPVPLVVREVYDDAGDATRSCSTVAVLETFDPEPRRLSRRPSEVSNFDVQLRMIYSERRRLLQEKGLWDETIAMLRPALLQRLLATKHLAMSGLWSRPNFLAMGDEPCPVTDEEAAGWLAARRVEAERTEEADGRARAPVRRMEEGEGSGLWTHPALKGAVGDESLSEA